MQFKALVLLSAVMASVAVTQAAPLISIQRDETPVIQSSVSDPIPMSSNPSPVVKKTTTNGSIFAITVTGQGSTLYDVYVNCSDGFRYAVASFQGLNRISIKCPNGSTPKDGGAYSQ
ncbi:hypothetical protein B0O80DRAFT_141461 [Mortierella sp. GBAus27b]|nr:hypothetical protein B0O80DRAFT_141461 [Mortierella sp. GBAus27b]